MNNGKKSGSKMKKKSQTNDKVKVAVSAEFKRKKYKEEDNEGSSNTEGNDCKCNKVNKVKLKETFKKYLNMVGENMPVDSSDSSMAKRKRMYIKTYGGGVGGMVNSNNKVKVSELSESEFKKKITKDFTYSFNNYLKLKLNAS
jgi:hypothetical protein